MAENVIIFKWDDVYVDPESQIKAKWNDNPYTWDEVQLIIEILDAAGTVSTAKVIHDLPPEKKKRLVRLILRRKGIKMYDEHKEVKDVTIKVEDVELLIKEVKAQILAENIDV